MQHDSTLALANSLNRKDFLRTLSYREFLSSVALAILMVASNIIIDFVGNENVQFLPVFVVYIFLLPILNHIWYKIEHRRSNNYGGRVLLDYILGFSMFVVSRIVNIVRAGHFPKDSPGLSRVLNDLMLIVLLVLIVEVLIGGLKKVLNKIGWAIL